MYYPYESLIEKCQEILQVDREIIIQALGAINLENRIVIEDLKGLEILDKNHRAVYLAKFYV